MAQRLFSGSTGRRPFERVKDFSLFAAIRARVRSCQMPPFVAYLPTYQGLDAHFSQPSSQEPPHVPLQPPLQVPPALVTSCQMARALSLHSRFATSRSSLFPRLVTVRVFRPGGSILTTQWTCTIPLSCGSGTAT